MSQRYSTIVFVPHARAKFRKLKVSHRAMFLVAGVLALSLGLSTFFSVQYFANLSRGQELQKLQEENQQLQIANEEFSKSVETLRSELAQVEERTRKLAIVAGIGQIDAANQGGVGGLRTGQPIIDNPFRDEIDTMTFRSRSLDSKLSILEDRITHQNDLLSSTPSISPVRGILTDGFGGRRDPFTGEPASHSGLDISSAHGHPVVAPADGIVVKSKWEGGYGNVIYLSHGFGYSSRFGHLSKFAVRPGQKISRGDVIGYVGSTGRSTGPHLHYEVRVSGKPVNPLEYVLDVY